MGWLLYAAATCRRCLPSCAIYSQCSSICWLTSRRTGRRFPRHQANTAAICRLRSRSASSHQCLRLSSFIYPRQFLLQLLLFTARCVCTARIMLSDNVCPSVCLSHAGIVSKRLNISLSFFTVWYFFSCQPLWQYFDGDLTNGGVECRW